MAGGAGGAGGDGGIGGAGGGATMVLVSTAESLAVLFPATPIVVIVAVAVFVAVEPGTAFGSNVAAMAYVTLLPAGRVSVSLMLPVPLVAPVAPPVAVNVRVADVTCVGSISTKDTVTVLGPVLLTVTV